MRVIEPSPIFLKKTFRLLCKPIESPKSVEKPIGGDCALFLWK